MATKILVYAIIFDIMIAILSGAYTHVMPPSFSPAPSYNDIVQQIENATNITFSTPSIPIIPPFSLGILGSFPGFSIPSITIHYSYPLILAKIVAAIAWVADYVVYMFKLFFGITFWVYTIMASVTTIMYNIPVIGPILLTIFYVINFIIIWEILKLIRGYGP